MVFIISETLIIFLLIRFIAKLTKENKELKEDIFSLKVQAELEDFYSDRNKKKWKRLDIKIIKLKSRRYTKWMRKNLKKG